MRISGNKWDFKEAGAAFTGSPPGSFSWGRGLVLAVVGALLSLAPLAYGAVHPWAYFTIGAGVSLVSLALLTLGLHKLWAKPQAKQLLPYPPLWWLGVGLGLILVLQVIPWPQAVLHRLSPAAWELRALGNGFGLAPYLPFSLNPYATWLEFLKLAPAVMLFFILIMVLNSRRQIRVLIGIILGVALFEVFYGLFHFHNHLIWGWPNPYSRNRLCGTFINCNHLACYLGLAILLGFGLLLEQGKKVPAVSAGSASSEISRLRRLSRPENSEPRFRQLLMLFMLLLITAGLIFTGSRGGMTAVVFGFLLMIGLVWSKRWKKGYLLLISGFLAAALIFSLYLGSAPQLARFQNLDDQERLAAMKGAFDIFKEYPLTGSGIGTFGELFYRYEPAVLNGKYFIYTHNDWLQTLSEAGLPGLLLLVVAGAAFGVTLVRQWRQRKDPFARYVGLGGIAALGAGAFHALTEFPFHIPALSLTIGSIAALTYATVFSRSLDGIEFFTYPVIRFPGPGKRAWVVVSLLLVVQLAFLGRLGEFYAAEYAASTEINTTRPRPALKAADFRRAIWLNPLNSKYYAGLSEDLEKYAREGRQSLDEAEKSWQAAILRAPGNWDYHFQLAELYLRRQSHQPGRYLPLGLKELAAAVKIFPESGVLHFRLASMIAWSERHYPGLVPPELRGQSGFHARMTAKFEPHLTKYLPKP